MIPARTGMLMYMKRLSLNMIAARTGKLLYMKRFSLNMIAARTGKLLLACVAADPFSFSNEDQKSERKAGERRSTPGMSKKIGEKWG